MKKDYKLKIENDDFMLENKEIPEEKFLINVHTLQFDTKTFYDIIFSNINEHIEITIEKDSSLDNDPQIQKISDHVYNTISSIIDQVCEKINIECFIEEGA